eukprot:COSAG02_NODE_5294_length_4463_cov_7.569432_4_plen_50_part_00
MVRPKARALFVVSSERRRACSNFYRILVPFFVISNILRRFRDCSTALRR